MSGSLNRIYDQVSYALALHSEALARLQEQAASGSKVNRVSDDPSTAYRLLGLNSEDRSLQNFMDNISEIISSCEMTTTVLEGMGSELLECGKLMTQIAGGIYGESNRQMIANNINDHLEQLVLLANIRHNNQFLFGGTRTTTAPYTVERDSEGQITSVTYQGSDQQRTIEVSSGMETSMFLVGSDVFTSSDRETPEFLLSNTGATLGSGTASVTGDVWLTVTQDGDGHYNLSIDDGATAIDLGGVTDLTNVAVTNADGQVLYVNASALTGTGTDLITVPGTFDIFRTLIDIRDLVENDHSLVEHQLTDLLPKTIDWITEVNDLVVDAEVSVGSRTAFLDSLKGRLGNIQANAQDESSLLEQADIAQVSIDLSRREVLYQMSLAVAGKLLSVSLLDYLK